MRNLLTLAICFFVFTTFAQSDIEWIMDPNEVYLESDAPAKPDPIQQQKLREAGAWKYFSDNHDNWYTIMSAETGLPHRAWGTPLDVPGGDEVAKAMNFINTELNAFGVRAENLSEPITNETKKHVFVRFRQMEDGYKVDRSSLVFKFFNGQLIMWGTDYYVNAEVPAEAPMSESMLLAAAAEGIQLNQMETSFDELVLMPLPERKGHQLALAAKTWVVGYDGAVPKRYLTYVDANTGEILRRINRVQHIDPRKKEEPKPKKVHTMGMPVIISGAVRGTVYPTTVSDTPEALAMPYLQFEVGGQDQTADVDGGFISNVTGPADAEMPLAGLYSTVFTNGTTPVYNTTLQDGYTVISMDDGANIRELSAYRSTNLIHDHMKSWLPQFTGLDFSLTTNIDVAGECNAFFDGVSINFFPDGGGCNPTSLIADVVFHEYGHAINGYYYNAFGSFFDNGAMNEGYADFWSLSLADSPLLAVGFYDDSDEPLRRYDIDPKVYPVDWAGQVHNDGEIICGAWWDSHLLMGADWELTRDLFVEAYSGFQAETPNDNVNLAGTAYTDVLLDALQADDDDGDLSNGTPNGLAILEGFEIHGITLFAYAEIEHTPVEFAPEDETLTLIADTEIVFPFGQYFDSLRAFYRFGPNEEWQSGQMTEVNNGFTLDLPAQDAMTVVQYYFGIQDIYGEISAVNPVAANQEIYPNLPFFTLVGVMPVAINDSDEFADFGQWDTGVSGDNATTGQWEETVPVGSTAGDNPPQQVAPDEDHTDGNFGFCFVTGENPPGGGVGENDVDGGHTTLLSPEIDLTEYDDPVLAYWRWYVNAPATGANPGADWWQVEVSDDGGSSWTYIENTLTQDISWRRNAIKISDHVDLTDEFQIRFIASDSIRPGENLDGGSLIEAAVDDIVIYDLDAGTSIDESADFSFNVFPNPASDRLQVSVSEKGGILELIDSKGRVIARQENINRNQVIIDLNEYASGQYFIRYIKGEMIRSELIQIQR